MLVPHGTRSLGSRLRLSTGGLSIPAGLLFRYLPELCGNLHQWTACRPAAREMGHDGRLAEDENPTLGQFLRGAQQHQFSRGPSLETARPRKLLPAEHTLLPPR